MSGNGQTPKSIDWADIHRRIEAMQQTFGDSDQETPELLQQAWARRAERIAQATLDQDEGEQVELVMVRLGDELYGLEAQYVFDIRPVEPHSVTRVPRAPGWVAGVVNWRGRILSVVDLQRFLGLLPAESTDDGTATRYLVVVETPEMELVLLADEALPMETVFVSRIQDATSAIRDIRPEYMRGLADRSNGNSMVILNLLALLADKQLIVHEEIV